QRRSALVDPRLQLRLRPLQRLLRLLARRDILQGGQESGQTTPRDPGHQALDPDARPIAAYSLIFIACGGRLALQAGGPGALYPVALVRGYQGRIVLANEAVRTVIAEDGRQRRIGQLDATVLMDRDALNRVGDE